jgi:hypothetical protein
MSEPLDRFRLDYAPLLLRYLTYEDEQGLRSAYDLGRTAMQASVGLLDILRVHNQLVLDILDTARDLDEARQVARASTALLIDLVASFEMSQRAFLDSHALPRQGAADDAGRSTES